jgi:hypothetical protein
MEAPLHEVRPKIIVELAKRIERRGSEEATSGPQQRVGSHNSFSNFRKDDLAYSSARCAAETIGDLGVD